MQGVLTKGIELGYKTESSGGTYTKIAGLKEFPDMGGAPEQIDITTFDDSMTPILDDNGNRIKFNDPKKSSTECLKLADEQFFNKSREQ